MNPAPRIHRKLVLSFVVAAFALSVRAAESQAPVPAAPAVSTPPSLATLINRGVKDLPAGGVVAAEITPEAINYFSAGSFAPSAEIAPEKVLFEIGSITKVFTGLLLAHAVLEGKAALTDPISKYLPADLALRPSVAAITLEQLATHTSGLPRMPSNFAPANPADPFADYTVERMYAFLRDHDIAKPAPHLSDYSNLGLGLLGHLLGRIYDKPWQQLIREKITAPLGMNDTVVGLDADRQARFAVPYSGTQPIAPWHLDALEGAGALRSTAADMSRFAQALLTGKPETLKAAWDLIRQQRVKVGQDGGIGLTVMTGGKDEKMFYHHGGATGGYRTHLEIVPGEKRAVVILVNNDTVSPGGLARRLRTPGESAAPAVVREEQPITAEQLAEFPGVYELEPNRVLTFILDDAGKLRLRLTGQPFGQVFFAGADLFFARIVKAEFQFSRDGAGKIEAVTLLQNGNELRAKRTDKPTPKVFFPPAEKLREYAGRYQLAPGMLFEIAVRGATLAVKLTGQPTFPVHNDAPDHFVYDVVEAALTFERGPDGTVTGLILHQNGNHSAPRLAAETK
jgi:D-alanyl-D-alanine-carboxypeptidase/D-alanyl-D-alanine-endopeptidase